MEQKLDSSAEGRAVRRVERGTGTLGPSGREGRALRHKVNVAIAAAASPSSVAAAVADGRVPADTDSAAVRANRQQA